MAKPPVIILTLLSLQGSWNELAHFIIVQRQFTQGANAGAEKG
ncbi:MAG: hypothetical protein ACJ710_11415 [Ornithinibacter sp.]